MRITETKHGAILVLALSGKLDTTTADQMEHTLLDRIRQDERQLILDMSDLAYISSTGLRVLFLAAKELQEPPAQFAICGLNARLQDVFATTGFSGIVTIYESLSQAIEAMEEAQ